MSTSDFSDLSVDDFSLIDLKFNKVNVKQSQRWNKATIVKNDFLNKGK